MAGIFDRRFHPRFVSIYTEKIDAKFITYHEVQDWQDQDMRGYRMIFRDENDDTFEITVNVYIGYGMLDTF